MKIQRQVGTRVIGRFNKRTGTITEIQTCLISRTARFPFKTLVKVVYDDEAAGEFNYAFDLATLDSNFRSLKVTSE